MKPADGMRAALKVGSSAYPVWQLKDPKIGRAEALRRSILDLMDNGKAYEAQPAFWAPFVLVGEGGIARR